MIASRCWVSDGVGSKHTPKRTAVKHPAGNIEPPKSLSYLVSADLMTKQAYDPQLPLTPFLLQGVFKQTTLSRKVNGLKRQRGLIK